MGHSGNGNNSGSLFVGCGEASGDHYAALLIGALRKAGSSPDLWGMLGPEGKAAGGDVLWNSGSLSLMGVSEVLCSIPRLVRMKNEIAAEIISRNPAGVVVIDSPDFHIPLLKTLKKRDYPGRIFYIAPPTVWAWRQGRADILADLCDICFPLFDFEREFLESRGAKCRWFGHPLVREMRGVEPARIEAREGRKIAALLPGSRRSEIRHLLPPLLEAAKKFAERGFLPVFSIAPGLDRESADWLSKECSEWTVFKGHGSELMAASDVVTGASGTAAVEAMILRKFMIVLYRVSLSSSITYRLFVKTPWISIPNILAGEDLYPELLQSEVSPDNIIRCFDRYIENPEEMARIDAALGCAVNALGEGDAPAGWAQSILEMTTV